MVSRNFAEKIAGRKAVGAAGEQEACDFLESRGMQILERNWRGGHTEVDVIALDAAGLHFVEVKTRVAPLAASPEENVRSAKMRTLVKAAQIYLHGKDTSRRALQDCEVFFDVVSVVLDRENTSIEFLPNAFIPLYM